MNQDFSDKPIGIMGGAFNPFHNGHLRHAIEVFERIPLAHIEILPSGQHPHKKTLLPFEIREKCIALSIEDISFMQINSMENRIDGPSYTDKILRIWREQNPNHTPYFLMGTEDFALIASWNNGFSLPELAHLLIVSRNNDDAKLICSLAKKYWGEIYINSELSKNPIQYIPSNKSEISNLTPKTLEDLGFEKYLNQDLTEINKLHIAIPYLGFCTYLDIPCLEITATSIRNLWKNNQCIQGLLPKKSLDFLNNNTEILKKFW